MSMKGNSRLNLSYNLFEKREEEIRLTALTYNELLDVLMQAIYNSKLLSIENHFFERYLKRNDPQFLITLPQKLENFKLNLKGTNHSSLKVLGLKTDPSTSSGNEKRSHSYSSLQSGSTFMTHSQMMSIGANKIHMDQRLDMLENEFIEAASELALLTQQIAKKKKILRAKLVEVEQRICETCNLKEEFEEKVIKNSIEYPAGKIPLQKFTKFFDDWLKKYDSLIEKLRLKTYSTKLNITLTKKQIIQKEMMGADLRPVDFTQLQTENQMYAKQIDEKNSNLAKMKFPAAKLSTKVALYKHKIKILNRELNLKKNEIESRKQQINKIFQNYDVTLKQLKREEREFISLSKLLENYEVPEIMDFVKLKSEFDLITKVYKRLSRRKNILEITKTSR